MGKYSSDSDSEKRRNKRSHKSSNRRRSSSSESSSSRNRDKKYNKTIRKRRTRSRSTERVPTSRRSHESYTRIHKSKSYSKSGSRSREQSRQKRSVSRDRHRIRSYSKEQSKRRSRSRSYIKEYVSKKRRSSSSSSSYVSSSSSSNNKKCQKVEQPRPSKNNENGTGSKLNMVVAKEYDVPLVDMEVLNEINKDSFTPKLFASKNTKIPETIVIDLKKQTIKMPQIEPVEPDSIFHHNLFLNEEARSEKWVKELFSYRQKALQQGIKNQ